MAILINLASISFQIKVNFLESNFSAFYDPDGYYFGSDGKDEFGGYYDDKWYYHPGDKNKHEFDAPSYDEEDELVR